MNRVCIVCNKEFDGRADARFDSDACRKKFARDPLKYTGIDEGVEMVAPKPISEFHFYTVDSRSKSGYTEDDDGNILIRDAKYWYDVPLGAVPFNAADEPEMPKFMNGRQYFLWRANGFDTGLNGPVIIDPTPKYKDLKYDMGGENARKWGA
jgi:hypothetical protein